MPHRRLKMVEIAITPEKCFQSSGLTDADRGLDSQRISFLVKKEFRTIAGDKRLGVAWAVLEPVVMSAVYLFVFTVIRSTVNGATVFVGITLIRILTDSVMSGVNAISDFSGGIKSERVRSRVLIMSKLYFRILDSFFHSIGTIVILYFAYGINALGLFSILIASIIIGVLSEGVGLTMAMLVKKVSDVKTLIKYALLLMFFGSPALYPLGVTSGFHRTVNEFNPFTYLVEACRYFSDLDSSVKELDWRLFAVIYTFLAIVSFRGYREIDRLRWRLSTW
jgi:ABC-type polysaccharide/polyol phosphate export permease